jgi:hypothetical protein
MMRLPPSNAFRERPVDAEQTQLTIVSVPGERNKRGAKLPTVLAVGFPSAAGLQVLAGCD